MSEKEKKEKKKELKNVVNINSHLRNSLDVKEKKESFKFKFS